MTEIKTEIYEVGKTDEGSLILLQGTESYSDKVLPILCNQMQGRSIKRGLSNKTTTRPQTHELFIQILNEVGGAVNKITIDGEKNGIYFSRVHIQNYDENKKDQIKLDARPSDSIAIAIRERAPIYVKEKLIKEKGVSPSNLKFKSSTE